jgi:phenylacetic acid degradation protein PaaD
VTPLTPQQRAERAAAAMWAGDAASQALGMRLVEVAPGRAVVEMEVRADMINGQAIGHGGLTFTLADSAFAFACNSHNRRTVARECEIRFLAPTRRGDVLVAEAVERHREGRDGTYEVTVRCRGEADGDAGDGPGDTSDATDQGRVVALFTGRSREVGGTHVPEDPPQDPA